MNRTQQIRAGVTLVLTLLSLYLLLPTFRAATISPAERAAAANDPALKEKLARIDAKAIRRGLDLQGGVYLALEVESEGMTPEQQADALKRVTEIIRNRIDQFGVSEPIIQTQGTRRIIVQLPGMVDPERAKELIGRTARLEFRLVRPAEEVSGVLARLDEAFRATGAGAAAATPATPATAPAAADTATADPFKSLPSLPATDNKGEDEQFAKDHPLTAYVQQDENFAPSFGTPMFVQEDEVPLVEQMLARPAARAMGTSVVLQFDSEPVTYGALKVRPLYLLNAVPSMTGDRLTNARTSPDPDRPGGWQVEMTLDRKGARQFSKVTGENVGRNLAITLDGRVSSAPNIRGKIPSGKASITGTFTHEQASDLSLLLRAGALPANIRIEEERTVGPGLGRDSIRQGVNAGLIGASLVVLLMIFYYRLSGVVSIVALIINLLILMATLAQFGLVLTLPGIAGIVLTVGMAVDANVLINERIREELRKNKTVRAAIDAGFFNATRTIIDAHATQIITALILLWFGTGAIKGFAVTLTIGILTTVFTSLVSNRFIMESIARDPRRTSLSI
ncbi:MAG: protein translocase subunit SecD [Candidatus Krumholzibacteriia bacterium]